MAQILPRSTYTSQPDGFARIGSRRRDRDAVALLVAHYGAFGRVDWPNPTLRQTIQRLLNVRSWHLNNGWADIGYDYAVDQAGRIIRLRSDDYAGAGAIGHNFSAVHVLFLVGDNERPSAAARRAFRALGRRLRRKFTRMSTTPRGHGQLPRTQPRALVSRSAQLSAPVP